MEETEITISNPSPVSEVKLDNFQNTFVGRYNELLYIFQKKVTNLNEIVKLIEPYIEIEKTYFQNFEKFVKQNKNFTGTGSITGNSNMFDPSFDPKLSETFDLFKHWLNVLHSSSDTALKRFKAAKEDLEKFNTEFDQEKKKFLSYLTTHQKELSSSTKKLFKARDKYYKTCREELSLPSPDTVKMSSEKEAYNYHIRIVNNAYEKFFKNNFPAKLSEIESLFIKRLRKIQSVLDSVINSKIDSFKELNDSINGQLLSAISSIKVEDEIDEITRKYNPSNDPFTKTIAFTFQEYSEKQPISQSILANAIVESPIHLIPSVSSHEMVETTALSPSTTTLSPKLVHTRSKHDFDASLNLSSAGNEPLNGSAKKTKNPFRMITSRRNHEKRRSNDFGSNGLVPPSPLEGCANNLDSPANSKVSSEVASPVVVPGDVIVTQSEVAVMKVPLEVLMEREKEKEKRLCEGEGVRESGCGVPEVERFLVESLMLLDLQGLKGVFKRGGKMPLINELKKSLDDGKFVRPTDPYVCADVLKLWLRNLPEPLVPNELYEESLKCVTDEESFIVYEQLKEPNKSVLGYLACFASHLSEFASSTGVKDSDLASVLSPCVLRCPYTDVNEMISAAEKQTGFVLGLLDAAKIGIISSDDFARSLERVKTMKNNDAEKVIHINSTENHEGNNDNHEGNNDNHEGNNEIHNGNNDNHEGNNDIHNGNNDNHEGNNDNHNGNGISHEIDVSVILDLDNDNDGGDDDDDIAPPMPSKPAPPIPTCPPPPIPDMF